MSEQSHDAPGQQPPKLPPGSVVAVAVLCALPVVALMWVSSYAKDGPTLWGFPFFYWYQFLWVFLAAGCTTAAYRVVVHHERRRGDRAVRGGGRGVAR